MRIRLLVFFLCLHTYQVFSQCNCSYFDSITNKEVKKNWDKFKGSFVPNDLNNYTLLIEDFNSRQIDENMKLDWENYHQKLEGKLVKDTCDLQSKNFIILPYNQLALIKKFYDGKKRIVNVDYINKYDVSEFPYVVMWYGETIWVGKNGDSGTEIGFYIWDRKAGKKFKVICVAGKKDQIWFYKNLNK